MLRTPGTWSPEHGLRKMTSGTWSPEHGRRKDKEAQTERVDIVPEALLQVFETKNDNEQIKAYICIFRLYFNLIYSSSVFFFSKTCQIHIRVFVIPQNLKL